MSQLQVTGEAKIRDIQGPVVANDGVVTALDGAASQYVRGDGTLADFPTSTGGGSSVSYYLNSSVSQGTIGGVAYRQLSKDPIIGAGTDIAISANGYVASYITNANDPDVTIVPGGNFNCEFYFSVNNNTGNPTTYAELYKYDGTTFTLLGTSAGVPESINQGTTIAPYYFAIPVATAALALTDRLAIRIYVNVGGRTVTLHTENGHLCQVVTTLSKGMVSLNNLTDQSQFITTGTSGTNFAIVSSGDTHTFNLPVASATNTGKLSSTDWSTFNNKQAAGNYVTLDTTQTITAYKTFSSTFGTQFDYGIYSPLTSKFDQGILFLKGSTPAIFTPITTNLYSEATSNNLVIQDENSKAKLVFNNSTQTYTFPAITGTLALLEGTQTFTGAKTFSGGATFTLAGGVVGLSGGAGVNKGLAFTKGSTAASLTAGMVVATSDLNDNNIVFADNTSSAKLQFQASGTNTYTFPAASGTIALTSDLSAYVTLATAQVITGSKIFGSSVTINTAGQSILSIVSSAGNSSDITSSIGGVLKSTISTSATEFKLISAIDNILKFQSSTNFRASLIFSNTADYSYTYPNATGTIALTSNLSAYLPLSGGTLTGALTGTSVTFSGALTVNGLINNTYSDNAYLGIIIRNTNTGNQALSGFSIQNSEGTTVGQVNYVSTVYANTTLRNTLLINTVFNNKLAFATNSSGGDTRADIYFTVNPAFTLDVYNPNQIHILGSSRNVIINYSGTDFGANFQVNGTTRLSAALSGTSILLQSNSTTTQTLKIVPVTSQTASILNIVNSSDTVNLLAVTSAGNVIMNGGSVGIGTSSPLSRLNVSADNNDANSGQLVLNGSTDSNKRLSIGYNTTSNFGFISVYTALSGYNALALQPNGGNVGIGTSSPVASLHVAGAIPEGPSGEGVLMGVQSSFAVIHLNAPSGAGGLIDFSTSGTDYKGRIEYSNSSNFMRFGTDGAERMRIISSGNVGIGTSSPNQKLTIADASYPILGFNIGSTAQGYIGSLAGGGIAINSQIAQPIMLYTNDTERMRITSGGNVLIGTTSDDGGIYRLQIATSGDVGLKLKSSSSAYTSRIELQAAGSGASVINAQGGSNILYVSSNNTNGVYLTSGATSWTANSDERLKNINGTIENAVDKLKTLRPVNFSWKSDENKKEVLGLIAQDVEKVFPQVIDKNKLFNQKTDIKDETEYLGVRYVELVPVLIAAIQEQQAQIEELKQLIKNK